MVLKCEHPVFVRRDNKPGLFVGCGHCYLCCKTNQYQWRFRLVEESKKADTFYFLTLTIAPEHMPENPENGLAMMQRFVKRFRKGLNKYDEHILKKFKYYACSELGHDKGRLHLHMLLFNVGLPWNTLKTYIEKKWGLGFITLKTGCEKDINYCVNYMVNKMYVPRKEVKKRMIVEYDPFTSEELRVTYDTIECKPIQWYWRTCSKGLGTSFITPQMIKYVVERGDGCITTYSRKAKKLIKLPVPKYLLDKIYADFPEEYELLKASRLEAAESATVSTGAILFNVPIGKAFYRPNCNSEPNLFICSAEDFNEYHSELARADVARRDLKTKYKFKEPPIWFHNLHSDDVIYVAVDQFQEIDGPTPF